MEILALRENEVSIIEKDGDCWDGLGNFNQVRGTIQVTNQRVAFRKTGICASEQNLIELELSTIDSIKKSNVGNGFLKIVPTGVKVTTTDGGKHIFSIMKRENFIQALQGMAE